MAKSLTRLFRRFLTSLLWLVSILVIIFVICLSIIKLTLPYWTENKQRMVALVEEQVGGEFDYETLEVDWSEFKPSIFLQDASWKSDDGSMVYQSANTRVILSFWESLFKGYIVTETIDLNNVKADFVITPDASQEPISYDLGLLLKRYPEVINQESIGVDNLTIGLTKGELQRKIQVEALTFTKLGKQRQLTVELQSDFASQAKLVIESEGEPLADENPLKIYGLLRDFDVADSAKFFELPQGIPVELADSELWLEYRGDRPVSGRLLFHAESSASNVASLDAEINYLNDQQLAIFSSDKFSVVERLDNGDTKKFNSYFKVVREQLEQQKTNWTLEAENTPIGYFTTLTLPFLPSDIRQKLLAIQPQGELVTLDIKAQQDKDSLAPLSGRANIINFSTQASDSSPQLELQSIVINQENAGWRVEAASKDTSIHWPGMFNDVIEVGELNVDTWVSFDKKPVININNLSLVNDDVDVKASGVVRVKDGDADLSLYGEANNINIEALEHYWPRQEMDEDVLEFLDEGLLGGTVDFARLTWRGDFEHFPYEDNSGIFDLRANVSKADFKFDPEWPEVNNLTAQAQFKNNQLFLSAENGFMFGQPIGKSSGVIESLFTDGSVLKLDIDNQVNYELYKKLYLNSPMQEWLGEELLDLTFSGSLKNQLHLNVPLSEDSDDTSLEGYVYFNGQNVALETYQLKLSNVKGQLTYTEKGAYAEDLKASIWQSPVTIDIAVDEYTNNNDLVEIDANSNFDLAKAVASLKIELPVYVEGNSAVSLHYRQDSEGSESLIVRSDLKGTEINGPSWLSKGKDSNSSFLSTLYRKDNRIHARTIYRDTVSSQLSFGVDTPGDINGVIALGDLATHTIDVPAQGVAIEGFFAEIHSNEWLDSLQMKKEGEFFWPQWIDHISVKTALFTVAGQSLHDVELTDSLLADDSVRFNVAAREGRGNLTLYKDGRKHVTVEKLDIELKDFSRLSSSEVNLNKTSLDNWQLECLDCRINGIDTGKLTLVSKLEKGIVEVKGDSQIEGQLSAYLEGQWKGNNSLVNISFTTDDTGGLLQRWGYGDGVKDTVASGNIELNWQGGFHDFALKNLNGKINLETGEGAVKELSDRQARVFSLFSLQSIRRRLSLDFSDLFEDGFFYDKMLGVFTVKQGVVHSDDVFIDGAAADVKVEGSIDLVKQTVNQNVTVVPKLGSSLPILAGWAVEPTTGLIMLLVNKIFEPVIDVVVSIEYKVQGDLSNPTVVELSKESKEVVVPESEEEEALENGFEEEEPSEQGNTNENDEGEN